MSLWDEQKRILNQNLEDVLKRPPGSGNRHVLEAITHRRIQHHVENIGALANRGRHAEAYEAWKSALSDTKELRDKPYLYEHLHLEVIKRLLFKSTILCCHINADIDEKLRENVKFRIMGRLLHLVLCGLDGVQVVPLSISKYDRPLLGPHLTEETEGNYSRVEWYSALIEEESESEFYLTCGNYDSQGEEKFFSESLRKIDLKNLVKPEDLHAMEPGRFIEVAKYAGEAGESEKMVVKLHAESVIDLNEFV